MRLYNNDSLFRANPDDWMLPRPYRMTREAHAEIKKLAAEMGRRIDDVYRMAVYEFLNARGIAVQPLYGRNHPEIRKEARKRDSGDPGLKNESVCDGE